MQHRASFSPDSPEAALMAKIRAEFTAADFPAGPRGRHALEQELQRERTLRQSAEQLVTDQQAVIEEMGRALDESSVPHVPPRSTCNCCWCRCDRQADLLAQMQDLRQKDRDEIDLLKNQLWDAKAALLELEAQYAS